MFTSLWHLRKRRFVGSGSYKKTRCRFTLSWGILQNSRPAFESVNDDRLSVLQAELIKYLLLAIEREGLDSTFVGNDGYRNSEDMLLIILRLIAHKDGMVIVDSTTALHLSLHFIQTRTNTQRICTHKCMATDAGNLHLTLPC